MFKRKKIHQAQAIANKENKPKKGFWHKLKGMLSSKAKDQAENLEQEHGLVNPLNDITLEELELEILDTDDLVGEPDIEIAFINPETGELEVLNLPQDTFKVTVQESPNSKDEETVVVLELDTPLRKRKDREDEDPYAKITHFPPSSRLH